MLKKSFFAVLMLGALACGNNQETSTETKQEVMQQHEAAEVKYTPDMVVNEKDYTCGMPVTAGISDTCHYEGKAYGFCSAECMAEFKKDPAGNIAKK